MADEDKEISELDLAASFTGASEFPGLLGGLNKRFTGAQVLDYIGAATFVSPSVVSAGDFGLIADGSAHALSTVYANLAAAQVDYYFATSLTQQIDCCACKAAFNAAFGGDLEVLTAYVEVSQASDDTHIYDTDQNWVVNEHAGKTAFRKFTSNGFTTSVTILSNTATVLTLAFPMPYGAIGATDEYAIGYGEHGSNAVLNKKLFLPQGDYWFGSDTLLVRNLVGAVVEGVGERSTIIRGNETPFAVDGCWYTEFANFSVQAADPGAVVAFDLDGNVPGHPYATRGVQGVTLRNMLIDGAGSEYALAICRQGGSGGQGSECNWDKVHLSNAVFAPYYQNGFNALANKFIGGNVQNYTRNGMYVTGGTIAVIDTGFQSTQGYKQIENDGWDINVGSAGAYESCLVEGCRTESLRFLKNHGAVKVVLDGVGGQAALPGWFAAVPYGVAEVLYTAILEAGRVFVATTEGTSGALIPDFAAVAIGGTVADNTIVWTHVVFNFIDIAGGGGSINWGALTYDAGDISAPMIPYIPTVVDTDYKMFIGQTVAIIDATGGARTVKLPSPVTNAMRGYQVIIKKSDTSANAVTVDSQSAVEGGGSTLTIPGGSRGVLRLLLSDSITVGLHWQIV